MKRYRNVKLYDENNEDLDASVKSILEARKLENLSESDSDQVGSGAAVSS